MTEPIIIKTPGGEELVLLPRADYDALIAAIDHDEDDADLAAYEAAKAELEAARASGLDPALPGEVSAMILKGASRLTAWRKHRGMTQEALAVAAGIGQGYLSQLETGDRNGAPDTLKNLAQALDLDVRLIA